MNRIFIIIGLLLSFSGYASPPAKMIEITPRNIDELGFSIAVNKLGEEIHIHLVAPLKIDDRWVPVTAQVYSYKGDEHGSLNKVELGSPTKKISINSYYNPQEQDLMVGVYYLCSLDRHPCKGDWDSRIYAIQSVNQYLITSQFSSQPSAAGTPKSGAPN